jgi:hypothetical protein
MYIPYLEFDGTAQDMFENISSKNTELGCPFRDEENHIESCKQMLSAKSWIKGERADPVDEQLIIFERGKAQMKNDKLDSAMVVKSFGTSHSLASHSSRFSVTLSACTGHLRPGS